MAWDAKRLISKLLKRHPQTEKFDTTGISRLVLLTEGKTSNGQGVIENIFEIQAGVDVSVWVSGERLCVYVDPDTALEKHKLDRYGNEINLNKVEVVKRNG